MAHKASDNKAHGSSLSKTTSTKDHKRPTKERGPFGENNGTVQHRTPNQHKNQK
jgi:hypothetical protein